MKRKFVFIFFLVFCLFFLVGCDSDLVDKLGLNSINNDLYGSWKSVNSDIVDITFNKDGTGVCHDGDVTTSFTFTGDDDELKVQYEGVNHTYFVSYKVEDNKLEYYEGDVIPYSKFVRK